MTITNVGYDGPLSDTDFAQMSPHLGALVPVVGGRNDFAVTINSGGTLTCNVAAGSAAAPGVLTVSDGTVAVSFDAVVTTGQTRWDAVVLRRNWSSGTTTVVVVKGTAAANAPQVLPAGVDLVLDSGLDQVLALVQLTYGSTVPTAVSDRRLQGSKIFLAPTTAALPTPSLDLYGMTAELPNGDRYKCLTDVGGSAAWIKQGTPTVATTGVGTPATGFTSTGLNVRYSVNGSEVQYDILVRRTGASMQMDAVGNAADTAVFTVSGLKPDREVPVLFVGRGGSAATSNTILSFFGYINSAGSVVLTSGMPNAWLSQQTTAGVVSLYACIKFTKES